jgi:hypothetical protein
MDKRTFIASLILILATLACNLPSGESTQTPDVTATFTETPALPSDTPTPTFTALPTETFLPSLTPTPTIPIARPLAEAVNCRLGPGTEWLSIAGLQVDQTATIQGKNSDSSWWYVTTPNDPGKPCWVKASVTLTAGNLANLPIVNPPQASVTDVGLKLNPKEISLPLCIGPVQPITIKGTIETNGPVKVKYYFKTEQGGDQPIDDINFEFADTKTVETSYTPPPGPAGTYWVRLIIVSPNEKIAEQEYKIVCP